jgi:hypothetical protein
VFFLVALILLIIAAWDWLRYFDRSRTMLAVLGLSATLIVGASIAAIAAGAPRTQPVSNWLSVAALITLTLAVIQLYRSSETIVTIIRGWMYAIAIMTAITIYQFFTSDLPVLSGPFPSATYLAGSLLFGVMLMPIGFALEPDRRLRWTYPVVALLATGMVWTTHRSVAFGCCLAVLVLWLMTYRVLITSLLLVAAACLAAVFHERLPLRWEEVGMVPPLDASVHRSLGNTAWQILADSHFLGVGPGGLAARWPEFLSAYEGPYMAFVELACLAGVGFIVVVMLGLMGALVWSLQRLWLTRRVAVLAGQKGPRGRFYATQGSSLVSPERAPALWLAVIILSLPLTTSIQGLWLSFPMSALASATIALLARHVEAPQGRALLWSAGPNAVQEADGPPDQDAGLTNQQQAEETASPQNGSATGGGPVGDGQVDGEPQ